MSERENPAPAAHDRGGWATEEPIDQGEHQWADWEHRTQALARVQPVVGDLGVPSEKFLFGGRARKTSSAIAKQRTATGRAGLGPTRSTFCEETGPCPP